MTVAELMQALEGYPADLEVIIADWECGRASAPALDNTPNEWNPDGKLVLNA